MRDSASRFGLYRSIVGAQATEPKVGDLAGEASPILCGAREEDVWPCSNSAHIFCTDQAATRLPDSTIEHLLQ